MLTAKSYYNKLLNDYCFKSTMLSVEKIKEYNKKNIINTKIFATDPPIKLNPYWFIFFLSLSSSSLFYYMYKNRICQSIKN